MRVLLKVIISRNCEGVQINIWDASVLDHGINPSLLDEINQEADDSLLQDKFFDEFGDLQQQVVQHLDVLWDSGPAVNGEHTLHVYLHESNPTEQDWKSLRPYFGWQSEQVIQNTYKVTSRFGGPVPHHDYLRKHTKSRNPVFNIPRRNKPVRHVWKHYGPILC